ncbi:hypothetical protein B9Z19DRAFT_261126 [Tuber borchii]|uniref:Uncharacterized protein n=1 Tax=Tuber borchii TaxID=42251 RepID=A0A2T6ZLC3_TUBBO|nr:hypothetical protein B9Z19DRAFT_261126 [Tuber borchii]
MSTLSISSISRLKFPSTLLFLLLSLFFFLSNDETKKTFFFFLSFAPLLRLSYLLLLNHLQAKKKKLKENQIQLHNLILFLHFSLFLSLNWTTHYTRALIFFFSSSYLFFGPVLEHCIALHCTTAATGQQAAGTNQINSPLLVCNLLLYSFCNT